MAIWYNKKYIEVLLKGGAVLGKQVLLINDLPGYGEVALAAMMPILTHMGHHIYNLPTALVSNTLDYGKFEILDTTDYMIHTLDVWRALNFSFDAVSTGFIVTEKQAEMIREYCVEERKKGTLIFVDPIMGDEGHLYNGLTDQTVAGLRNLISAADFMVPNYTEASFLAGVPYKEEGTTEPEIKDLLLRLHEISRGSVIITSAKVDGKNAVAGYDAKLDKFFLIHFSLIPMRFPGTGDIFSAVFMGGGLHGKTMKDAASHAMDTVRRMIEKNLGSREPFKGIPIETCLEVLD